MNFNNSILLITGGTGSFGNALVKHLVGNAKEIRIFSRDEKKQDEMRNKYKNNNIKYFIGDVRDIQSLREAVNGTDFVFHASALKQVPSCEFFPIEAVKTNVLGTDNVLTASIEAGVKKVVCLSTDKSCYPINSMGMTKALMEKVVISKSRSTDKTQFIITRYGNVMCSRGSVIPLFVEQIKTGTPITVTDPKMTRFLMSLDEAIKLVLYAFEHGNSGDIFIQKSPSCHIGELASVLDGMFDADVPIKIIGTRHGEKQYETLLTREEFAIAEDLGDYYKVSSDKRDLNYPAFFTDGIKEISSSQEYNSNNTKILNYDEIFDKLLTLEYIQNELKEWFGQ